jgi:alpha-mannosidase
MSAKIVKVVPTVFFVGNDNDLRQKVNVVIHSTSGLRDVRISFEFSSVGISSEQEVGIIASGETLHELYVPDIRKRGKALVSIKAGSSILDSVEVDWVPKRHWRLHLIQSSHHDLGYTDLPTNLPDEFAEFYETLPGLCAGTDDFPEESKFRYVIEQSWSIMHFMNTRPKEVREQFIELIKQGRIEVTALFGNVTTELCGHEELIRLLYPSFELKRKYGIDICSAEHNDIPGMSWGLPSILSSAGIKYFSPKIPDYFIWHGFEVDYVWDEAKVLKRDQPGVFLWEGIDGGQILVAMYFWSCWPWGYDDALDHIAIFLDKAENAGYEYDVLAFRHHGGFRDNCPPDVRSSYIAKEWNSKWAYPKMLVSTNRQFFTELEQSCTWQIPVYRGELPNTDYTVAFSSLAKTSAVNRSTHDAFTNAEKFATIASLVTDYKFPDDTIKEVLQKMTYYDFHCLGMDLPVGPSQDASRADNAHFAYRAAALAQDVLDKSLNRIADYIECPTNDYQLIVFNPLPHKRSDVVRALACSMPSCGRPMYWTKPDAETGEVPVMLAGQVIGRNKINLPVEFFQGKSSIELVDSETGEKVPCQIVELKDSDNPSPWASERFALGHTRLGKSWLYELVFKADDVPALGHKSYYVRKSEKYTSAEIEAGIGVSKDNILENRFYRIEVDPITGAVISIFDKDIQEELVDSEAPHMGNQFIVRFAANAKQVVPTKAVVEKGEDGICYSSIRICTQVVGCPKLVQEIVLYHDKKQIDFNNRVLKDATPLLENYFAFPFKVDNPRFIYESSNSVIEPLVDQFPGSNTDYYAVQHWAEVSNDRFGIAFSSTDAANLEFGGLWPGSMSQAHHGVTPPGYDHPSKNLGDFDKGYVYCYAMVNNFITNFHNTQVSDILFRFSLTSYAKDANLKKAVKHGWEYHYPLMYVHMKGRRQGSLSISESLCSIDVDNVEVLTIKPAEDGRGHIVRLLETQGKPVTARLRLDFLELGKVYLTNVVEEDQQSLVVIDDHITVEFPPYSIRTVRVISK